MKVRTGYDHEFPMAEAFVGSFSVAPIPTIDRASQALRKAQDNYFTRYPEARKYASDLYWEIEKEDI